MPIKIFLKVTGHRIWEPQSPESAHVSSEWISALFSFPVSTEVHWPGDRNVLMLMGSTLVRGKGAIPCTQRSHPAATKASPCPHGAYTLEGEIENQVMC